MDEKFCYFSSFVPNDSTVSDDIAYDLMVACSDITGGKPKSTNYLATFQYIVSRPEKLIALLRKGKKQLSAECVSKAKRCIFREEVPTWQCSLINSD